MVDGTVVDKTTTAGIDVPTINTSGTATDVMTTDDDSPAITSMTIQVLSLPEPLMRLQLLI
jgi:hypothetical protein